MGIEIPSQRQPWRLGVAACLAYVAAAAVDRQARQSCRVWCGDVNLPCRGASSGRTAPPDTLRHRTHLSGGRAGSVHTATPDATRQSCLCRVWCAGVNWTIALKVFKLRIFCRRQSPVVWNPVHTAEADATQTRQFCRVWRGDVN